MAFEGGLVTMSRSDPRFDHERLTVYQKSLQAVAAGGEILDRIPHRMSAHDQLDRALTSIPLNIAEGNGKRTPKDRCRFFDNAKGSAFESAAALDVLVAKRKLTADEVDDAKMLLSEIVRMLIGVIRSNDSDRVIESTTDYNTTAQEPSDAPGSLSQSLSYS